MANHWLRLYAEFATDAKVQSMSEPMQRRLIMLFCLKCSNELVTLLDDELAIALRISNEELAETKQLFIRKGFINDDWEIENWDKRQYISDSSADRVKRHRENRKKKGLPAQDWISDTQRKEVFKADNNQCVYCGSSDDLTVDHKISRARGGAHDSSNWQTACRPCNASKRDMNHDEFIKYREGNGDVTLQKRPQITDTDTENTKNKAKKTWSLALPDWLEKSDWEMWDEHRNRVKKKSWTEQAKKLCIEKLDEFRKQGFSPGDVIKNSVANGYQGLFPPKVNGHAKPAKYDPTQESHEELRRMRAAGLVDPIGDEIFGPLRSEIYVGDCINGEAERLD